MQKKGWFVLGLLAFVLIVTSPILYNLGKAKAAPKIDLNTPVIAQSSDKECVEPKEYMRENHMQLLLKWRDSVVRDGQTVYINSQGKAFDMSLEDTCLKCHNNTPVPDSYPNPATNGSKTATTQLTSTDNNQFCFSCHNYAAVKPNCWNCHSDPREATK